MKIKKYVIFTVIVLIAITFGWFANSSYTNMQKKNVTNAAKSFASAVFKGDDQTAYNLTSKEYRNKVSLQDFKKSFEGSRTDNPIFDKEALIDNGKKKTVSYLVNNLEKNDEGSTTGLFTIAMIKESGKWKVNSAILQ